MVSATISKKTLTRLSDLSILSSPFKMVFEITCSNLSWVSHWLLDWRQSDCDSLPPYTHLVFKPYPENHS